MWIIDLAAADEGDDFEMVPFLQAVIGVFLARNEFEVDFDGDMACLDAEFTEQNGERGVGGDSTRLAVDKDLHEWARSEVEQSTKCADDKADFIALGCDWLPRAATAGSAGISGFAKPQAVRGRD
jgi:hypothetical protein